MFQINGPDEVTDEQRPPITSTKLISKGLNPRLQGVPMTDCRWNEDLWIEKGMNDGDVNQWSHIGEAKGLWTMDHRKANTPIETMHWSTIRGVGNRKLVSEQSCGEAIRNETDDKYRSEYIVLKSEQRFRSGVYLLSRVSPIYVLAGVLRPKLMFESSG